MSEPRRKLSISVPSLPKSMEPNTSGKCVEGLRSDLSAGEDAQKPAIISNYRITRLWVLDTTCDPPAYFSSRQKTRLGDADDWARLARWQD